MARKKKGELPSGSIRIQRKVGTDENGKRILKSFTGATRAEAEFAFREYMLRQGEPERPSLTVSEAVERYIDSKEEVLSPSTILNYRRILDTYIRLSALGKMGISGITNTDIQIWISDLSRGRSPKTIRNVFTMVKSAVEMFNPDFRFRVTLPSPKKTNLYCPSDDDVKQLLNHVEDQDLRIAILLAAFGPLRRSEICALTSSDIHGNRITVSRAVVMNKFGEWETKQPKTLGSYREIEMPDFVMKELSGIRGAVIKCSPSALSSRYQRAIAEAGCPKFRFHDLRHYAASIMHAIGVPDQYIMQRGGWATDTVMKRVYRNVIDIEAAKQTKKINGYFEKMAR